MKTRKLTFEEKTIIRNFYTKLIAKYEKYRDELIEKEKAKKA